MMFHSVCCALFLLLAFSSAGYSGQVKSGPSTGTEYSPEDALLTIRTHTGQSVFHIGEMIELDLAFTSPAPEKYSVDASTFDRSFSPDHVTVTPRAGREDPLGAFYRLCPVAYQGGLQNDLTLSPKPTIVPIVSNDWFRFEKPGEYEIHVDSGRVSQVGGRSGRDLILSSNRLPIRIIPATVQWQDETLRNALAVLDQTGTDTYPQHLARLHAAGTVRYLGTPAADT